MAAKVEMTPAELRFSTLFIKGTCPVTNGLFTKMTYHGFKAMCERRSKPEEYYIQGVGRQKKQHPRCKACKGEFLPDELDIISLDSGEG